MNWHTTVLARPPLCAVTLIDRRTGQPHRINGAALTALSCDPAQATRDLLAGLDPDQWRIRILPLPPGDAR